VNTANVGAYIAGDYVRVAAQGAESTSFVEGRILAITDLGLSSEVKVAVVYTSGSGSASAWRFSIAGDRAGDAPQNNIATSSPSADLDDGDFWFNPESRVLSVWTNGQWVSVGVDDLHF
jgi:hypothetical protein